MKRFLISTAILIALASPVAAQSFRKPAAEQTPAPAAQPQTTPVPAAPVQTAPAAAPSPAAPPAAPISAPAETEFEKRMREAREAAELAERAKIFNGLVDDRLAIGALTDEQAQKTKKSAVSAVEVEAMREIRTREIAAWTQSPDHKKAMETMKSRPAEFQPIVNAAIARGGWLTTAEIARISAQSVAKAAVPAAPAKQAAAVPAQKPASAQPAQPQQIRGQIARIVDTANIEIGDTKIALAGVAPGTEAPTQFVSFAGKSGPFACQKTAAAWRCTTRDGDDLSEIVVASGWARAGRDASATIRDSEQFARSQKFGIWR
jgi:endonuclease YncB( thermonuclease family)